jgi:hypothetical protein
MPQRSAAPDASDSSIRPWCPPILRLAAKWLMAFAGPVPMAGLHSTVDLDELVIGDTGHEQWRRVLDPGCPQGQGSYAT